MNDSSIPVNSGGSGGKNLGAGGDAQTSAGGGGGGAFIGDPSSGLNAPTVGGTSTDASGGSGGRPVLRMEPVRTVRKGKIAVAETTRRT